MRKVKKGFFILEVVIALLLGTILFAVFASNVYISNVKKKFADRVIGHIVALDVALMSIDMQLKSQNPNLNFPVRNPNRPLDLICVSRPFLWKNLPLYSAVAPFLVDNYLDVRSDFVNLFRRFPATLNVSGGRIRTICLNIQDAEIRNYIVRANSNFYVNGSNVCYNLNGGAGYLYTIINYNCPW